MKTGSAMGTLLVMILLGLGGQAAAGIYVTDLFVLADEPFRWDVDPACENLSPQGVTQCQGEFRGNEDFDQSWGPLTAPQLDPSGNNIMLGLGWTGNGCSALNGTLEFYIVPDVCGGEGELVHVVSGDLGQVQWHYQDVDVTGILSPGQTYHVRVVEQDDGASGGLDYHIAGIQVLVPRPPPELWSAADSAEASGLAYAGTGTEVFNHLAVVLFPIGAVILLRIVRRRK